MTHLKTRPIVGKTAMSIALQTRVPTTKTKAPVLQPQPYRFTVAQYNRMTALGILTANDHVELLEGWIVEKMPRNPPHDGTITKAMRRLMPLLPEIWLLRIQSAITLSDSQPEPDLAIVRGSVDIYMSRHPVARDIRLLIEVADATLLEDQRIKGPIYARARVSIYWIINIGDSKIEVYTRPRGGRSAAYRQKQDYDKGQSIPLILDDQEIARIPVKHLLP
jgi:hypothetical protein